MVKNATLSLSYAYKKSFTTCIFLIISCLAFAQKKAVIIGQVNYPDTTYEGIEVSIGSQIKSYSDSKGRFELREVPFGKAVLEVHHRGTRRYKKTVEVNRESVEVNITLSNNAAIELEEVFVQNQVQLNDIQRLGTVRGNSVFEAKKNDVLVMKNIDANLATNTARQVFAKVASTNVWENDGSGIQLNVSSRGLSPNRSWEYNMRQNGYDIAADILGYPDMYYSPPMDAISQIEVVRGAASLQYGTQMGGLLHFILKDATDKPFELEMKQSVGSYGLFNSYNSIGGTKNKWTYFGYFHHRSATGWRENSDYRTNTGFASFSYQANDKLKISGEYTRMNFLLHLSAGAY